MLHSFLLHFVPDASLLIIGMDEWSNYGPFLTVLFNGFLSMHLKSFIDGQSLFNGILQEKLGEHCYGAPYAPLLMIGLIVTI